MKLYLIRHGESETNLRRCYTGWLDVPLTEKGEHDALFAKGIIEGINFDEVFSSDLLRAVRTANIALPSCAPKLTPLLREFDVGCLANVPIASLTQADFKSIRDNGFSIFGGESRADFIGRVREFMHLMEKSDADSIAAFTHNGFIRIMMEEVIGATLIRKKIVCANCAVCVFEYSDSEWKLHSLINQ